MSRRAWIEFERRGGLPPSDDEALILDQDGAFTARRTIGGPAIGAFEGRLDAASLRRLSAAVDGLAAEARATIPTPRHGATETITAAGLTLQLSATERPPGQWRALVLPLRKLFEREVIAQPRAAVRLIADTGSARLAHAGDAPIDVDLGTLQVRVVHMTAGDAVRAQWLGRPTEGLVDDGEKIVAKPAWVSTGAGWTHDVPFDHPFRLAAGEWLQVWVDLAIRADGLRRAGQLYLPVIPDA